VRRLLARSRPNPDSKRARRCAFRRRTSGNCEVFHIVALPPSIGCGIRLAEPIGQRLSAWIADATFTAPSRAGTST
jgi:hypothetical protein